MLVYKDTKANTRRDPPPWLDGAEDLQECTERSGKVRYWGIDNPHLVGDRDGWIDLDDGWSVSVAGPIDPQDFRRIMRWCRTVQVEDTQGREWTVPVILNQAGDRVILATYNRDFLPILSAAQTRALEIANGARSAVLAAQEMDDAGLDQAVAARGAAELLSLTHHISMEAIAALGLLDDALILSVLAAATGLKLKRAEDDNA